MGISDDKFQVVFWHPPSEAVAKSSRNAVSIGHALCRFTVCVQLKPCSPKGAADSVKRAL